MRTRITPNTDAFYAVIESYENFIFIWDFNIDIGISNIVIKTN